MTINICLFVHRLLRLALSLETQDQLELYLDLGNALRAQGVIG